MYDSNTVVESVILIIRLTLTICEYDSDGDSDGRNEKEDAYEDESEDIADANSTRINQIQKNKLLFRNALFFP